MATSRLAHTATLLPSGNVLVTGGRGPDGAPLASVEVYDPVTGVWNLTGVLANARYNHTATLLPSGKVLATGGQGPDGAPLASAEVYDPSSGVWSPTTTLTNARYDHTATLLPSGKVLVAGGRHLGYDARTSAEVYDPVTGVWSPTGPLANARERHTATLLPSGKVLVAGGDSLNGYLAGAEVYDPATGAWSPTAPLATARYSHTATLLPSGKVLVAGGETYWNGLFASAELYVSTLVVTAPANGSTTNNNRPIYRGLAEAGSTVTVFVDEVIVGTTTADASGQWSVAQLEVLADGSHMVRAQVMAAAGNTDADSDTNTFTVDATPPTAPVVTAPANSATTNGRPTYSGTVEAGCIVIVFVNGAAVGAMMANASGRWSLEQPVALADGSHMVRARAMDAAGNTGADSDTNTFTVDATSPAAPVVTTPANGLTTNKNRLLYSGTAEAGSTVTVFVDGVVVGITTADASGMWNFTQPDALAGGRHAVRARATDAVGNTGSDSNTNTFMVTALMVTNPANGATSTDTRPIYSGLTDAGSTVTVFVDGVVVGITTTDASGMWNFTQPDALAGGHHTVRARATDAVDNISADSDTNTFTIMQRSHYGWSCATTPVLPATWALLALALFLGRRHRAR